MPACLEKVFWTLTTAQFGELNLPNEDNMPWSFRTDPTSKFVFTHAQPEC